MAHPRNYKVIRYSDEHIHIAEFHRGTAKCEEHIHERCFLSRNWSTCTARDLTVQQYNALNSQDRSYYDGNGWSKAGIEDAICWKCSDAEGIAALA